MQIWLIKNPGNRAPFSLPNNAKSLTIRPGIFPQNFFSKNKKHHCGRENNHNGTVSVPVHRCIKPQHCIEVVWRLYNSSVHTVLFSTKLYWLLPFSKCEKNYCVADTRWSAWFLLWAINILSDWSVLVFSLPHYLISCFSCFPTLPFFHPSSWPFTSLITTVG